MNNDIESVFRTQKREERFSHAYLVETDNYELFNDKLKNILKILLCSDNSNYCDNCQNCSLINHDEHPNIMFISPDGASIKISQIEVLKKQFSTKPTFAKYNIYVINEAEKLNVVSANALLKILEEPEENIIGILITSNKSLLLPTIKSRCQFFSCIYAQNDYNDEVKIIANKIEELCKSWIDILGYSALLNELEDRSIIKNVFSYMLNIELRKGLNITKIEILQEFVEKMRYNVNIDLFLLNYLIRMCELNE